MKEIKAQKETCDLCHKAVSADYVCRFVPEGNHLAKECLSICQDCLNKTGIVGEKTPRKKAG